MCVPVPVHEPTLKQLLRTYYPELNASANFCVTTCPENVVVSVWYLPEKRCSDAVASICGESDSVSEAAVFYSQGAEPNPTQVHMVRPYCVLIDQRFCAVIG